MSRAESAPSVREVVSSLTVREVIDWYLQTDVKSVSAAHRDEKGRILGAFAQCYGDRPVNDCRPAQLMEFLNSHKGIRAGWTRRRWVVTLKAPFLWATRFGLIGRNPFAMIPSQPGDYGRDLSDAEFALLLRHSSPEFRRVLIFLRHSGARPGEMKRIGPEDVHLDSKVIILQKHKTAEKTGIPRKIVLTPCLWKLLVWLLRGMKPGQKTVFTNTHGTPWQTASLSKYLRDLRRKLGLPADAKLYGLRHAFATRAIMADVPTATVAELLGHRHLATTERYIHLAPKVDHLIQSATRATNGSIAASRNGTGAGPIAGKPAPVISPRPKPASPIAAPIPTTAARAAKAAKKPATAFPPGDGFALDVPSF